MNCDYEATDDADTTGERQSNTHVPPSTEADEKHHDISFQIHTRVITCK